MNSKIAVDTPAYGLNTPEGIEITPSSFCSSTSFLRSVLCAAASEEGPAHVTVDLEYVIDGRPIEYVVCGEFSLTGELQRVALES